MAGDHLPHGPDAVRELLVRDAREEAVRRVELIGKVEDVACELRADRSEFSDGEGVDRFDQPAAHLAGQRPGEGGVFGSHRPDQLERQLEDLAVGERLDVDRDRVAHQRGDHAHH